MKIQQELEIGVQVRASLNEAGELVCQAIGGAAYHDQPSTENGAVPVCTAVVDIKEPYKTKIKDALTEALTATAPTLLRPVTDAIATHRQVGKARQEIK